MIKHQQSYPENHSTTNSKTTKTHPSNSSSSHLYPNPSHFDDCTTSSNRRRSLSNSSSLTSLSKPPTIFSTSHTLQQLDSHSSSGTTHTSKKTLQPPKPIPIKKQVDQWLQTQGLGIDHVEILLYYANIGLRSATGENQAEDGIDNEIKAGSSVGEHFVGRCIAFERKAMLEMERAQIKRARAKEEAILQAAKDEAAADAKAVADRITAERDALKAAEDKLAAKRRRAAAEKKRWVDESVRLTEQIQEWDKLAKLATERRLEGATKSRQVG